MILVPWTGTPLVSQPTSDKRQATKPVDVVQGKHRHPRLELESTVVLSLGEGMREDRVVILPVDGVLSITVLPRLGQLEFKKVRCGCPIIT
ncbi:hypothetical protein CLG94_00015 [Candidatus Methylomirabilis limnetica]|uniref:Uncharacterized protein n=1 Tax=Candidatus Methylomirabilis limnetica TaxID=2033718 RepID=A0A2T4U1M0_9BACT|nr:hypothetical protein [Candidatus Methylomirabilis limnetica]PTL37267.1 hypothetical protein CLG94_00015 [Candidatus Methylomirabilis limnetica]